MTQQQLARLPRLLWMYYSPAELAEEIGLNVDTVYKSYIPDGLPHKRDDGGRIWIIGSHFRTWALQRFKRKPKEKMPEGCAYCMHCRKATRMVNVQTTPQNQYTAMLSGLCAECGRRTNRASKRHD
jgi:hypothetical protein